MCDDPWVLGGDAWLGAVLGKTLQTATFLLLLYGGVAAAVVAFLTRL